MANNDILEKWRELKVTVESLELDIHKHASGNSSAGVRARRGLRTLKNTTAELVKLSLTHEKEKKANK